MFGLVQWIVEIMKFRMLHSQNKIVYFLSNDLPRFHVGANEFKTVALLPVDYRVEELKLGYTFNIIIVQAL